MHVQTHLSATLTHDRFLLSYGQTDRALEFFAAVDEWGFTSTPQIRYFFPEVLGAIRQDPRFESVLEQVHASFAQ